jgi:hypothetical protein
MENRAFRGLGAMPEGPGSFDFSQLGEVKNSMAEEFA